ncbi:hypothetical protein CerSpe_071000 [Prunus speciosa]
MSDLHSDPGLRTRILDYNPNIRDEIRRAYLQKGPCQPQNHDFPQKKFGKESRRFNPAWFDEFPYWLEYSIKEDVAFCLCCYLFKTNLGEKAGGDSFVGTGFSNWKKKERFQVHVGGPNSSHNQALKKCQALMNEKQHIENVFHKHSHQSRIDYRIRLNASVDCIRFLLRQGLAFRGHDESEDSSNQGNFLELLQFLVDHNEEVRAVALKNAPENLKVTSPKIQKDIVNAAAVETTDAIIRDMGDAFFSILVDESRDVSVKEQMIVMFLLIKLALTLPVATASVERAFSAMNIVKNRMRNRMGDQWMNDCLVVYLEKDIFNSIDNELIMQRFQNMKSRRGQL